MNRDQAYTLVRQTFTHAFDRHRFADFSKNLVNHLDESRAASWNSQYVKDAFRGHVQRYERLGTYTSPRKEKLDVIIVYLTGEAKLERARTAIRNFVADHLKTRAEKDAALVAFVSPSETTWRFSYVKMEYATVERDSGRLGVEARLTPARRFSYIVGEGESCHTAQTRFLDLLRDTQTDPTLADIEEAFSVEAVTREFFKKYVELFGEIHLALDKLVDKDRILRDDFAAKGVNTLDFAKKLLGQIVFLYFLQRKGWLGVAKGQGWGTGPRDFLRRLSNGEYSGYENFFDDVLEPLFYDTLAADRGQEAWCSHFNCRIPFLNGGLFEPLGGYDWQKTDILLPNDLFTNSELVEKEGVRGTGVLDVFDRYNFTVNEAEPLEKEVAIDPEMLGKVFENLIEENRRKGLGAFYTPREIVHYMCQESLVNYLDTSTNRAYEPLVADKPGQGRLFGEAQPKQAALRVSSYREIVPRADIERFIRLGEQISHYESVDAKYPIKMPKSIERHATLIDKRLAEIKVCDPAVGSGAFPVGMMTEIVRARSALTPYFSNKRGRTPYHFKRHAIQNCLYGVDIDPGAVEIAKLRLWLSLVVDEEEEVEFIKPLPNLDYKIMQGNSLVEDFHGICLDRSEGAGSTAALFKLDDEVHLDQLIEDLHAKQDDLFDATHPEEKKQTKEAVENAILEVFRHEIRRQKEGYFRALEEIEQKAKRIANPRQQQTYLTAEKAKLAKNHKFEFEAVGSELREMTHGDKLRSFFPWKIYFADVFRDQKTQGQYHAFHITWVTHNSRVSERMVEFGVHRGDPVILGEDWQTRVTAEIRNIVIEDRFRVLAYNILPDHVHLVLVCRENELSNIVRKLKGRSSQRLKEYLGMDREEPFHLWAQKYNCSYLDNEAKLNNAIAYVENNRAKHGVSNGVDVSQGQTVLMNKGWPPLVQNAPTPVAQDGAQEAGAQDRYDHLPPLVQSAPAPVAQDGAQEAGAQDRYDHLPPLVQNAPTPVAQDGAHEAGAQDRYGHLWPLIQEMLIPIEMAFMPPAARHGGFDVVIANPPYVRQEQIKDMKPALERQFSCYTGVSDLYVYFYERGFQLLREGGVLTFISSNKYFRSGYGEKLRRFLAGKATVHNLIDFGDAPVFEAIAYPSIIIMSKRSPDNNQFRALNWEPGPPVAEFNSVFHTKSFLIAQKELTADGWRLESPSVLRLLEKLRRSGTPLGEFVNGRFYRGVVTGFNEAFVVDRSTRDRLIAEHPSSAEVLKPFLRGRDVKRWAVDYQDLWLIFTRRGIDIKKYPAIHHYLRQFKDRLTPGLPGGRKPGSYEWFEIQDNIAYWQDFERPKIIYPDIALKCEFAMDTADLFPDCTLFLIPLGSPYLLGILNSKVNRFFFPQICPTLRGNFMRFKSIYVSQIPIPVSANSKPIETLVDQILAAKRDDPRADVSALEWEIDRLVYRLYDLTPEEIAIIEEWTRTK